MSKFSSIVFGLFLFQCTTVAEENKSCGSDWSDNRSLGIRLNSVKKELGTWSDTFYARAEHSDALSNISVDVLHNVTVCGGRRVIQIQGFVQNGNHNNYSIQGFVPNGNSSSEQDQGKNVQTIVFHSKIGSNVVVSNNRRTIKKKILAIPEYGVTFTNRALENDELFEVRLDQKGNRYSNCFGIGILNKDPEDVEILSHMHNSQYAWMYYNSDIYHDKREIRSGYGRDLNSLPAGTVFGVMKKASGEIQFFIDGINHGTAVTGISDPVYGVIELWKNAEKVTIVSP